MQENNHSLFVKKNFVIMGIVNITPDSFYDGGKYNCIDKASLHAEKLIREGADILDVGGESTRPGSKQVLAKEEIMRVLPFIKSLRKKTNIPISIDTSKVSVARLAFDAGANWINDVTAGRFDPNMPSFVAEVQCPVILMHSRKQPKTMQDNPIYDNVVTDVIKELMTSVDIFIKAGVKRKNIILDPGIGFAKRLEHNLRLIRHGNRIAKTNLNVIIGTSRKSFIGTLTGQDSNKRLAGSLASVAAAYYHGIRLFRVHDVAETKDLLTVLHAVEHA